MSANIAGRGDLDFHDAWISFRGVAPATAVVDLDLWHELATLETDADPPEGTFP